MQMREGSGRPRLGRDGIILVGQLYKLRTLKKVENYIELDGIVNKVPDRQYLWRDTILALDD
jgi:hypothetical protein